MKHDVSDGKCGAIVVDENSVQQQGTDEVATQPGYLEHDP
jgi:hypothetical protein